VLYCDTDSVGGESIINTNIGNKTIEDLWLMSDEKEQYNHNKYFGLLPGLKTMTFNKETGQLEEKNIKYIMKHEVKKKMYRIKCGNKSVDVTEDHSIIVEREGTFISITPLNILKSDKIIILK
jgi:intein/homing endonuclease